MRSGCVHAGHCLCCDPADTASSRVSTQTPSPRPSSLTLVLQIACKSEKPATPLPARSPSAHSSASLGPCISSRAQSHGPLARTLWAAIEISQYPLPSTHTAAPTVHTPHHHGALVTTDDPMWTPHRHPESPVDVRSTLGVARSVGLDECVTPRVHHHRNKQNRFTALEPLCAPPVPRPALRALAATELSTVSTAPSFPARHGVGSPQRAAFQTGFVHSATCT